MFRRNKEQFNSEEDKQRAAEKTLVNDIFGKFEMAQKAKAPYVAKWDKCLSAYNADYFKKQYKPDYKSDYVANFVFSTIETIKPIMLDNDPAIYAIPKTQKGMEVRDKIQHVFDNEWYRTKASKMLTQLITVALQLGTAIVGLFWDGQSENGLGNVKPVLINPYNFFPDPMATDIESGEYHIYATYKHVNELRSRFPAKANLLEGGTINYDELVSAGQDTSSVKNQVLVLECYLKDYSTYDEEVQDEDGKTTLKRVRKYPNGRIVTVAPELQIVLEDKPNPYKNGGAFPFKMYKCYDIPFQFWGQGEIEQILSPTTYVNDLINQVIDNAKQTANMPWIIDKNAGIKRGQLSNRPGLIIRKNPGTEVRRDTPPNMPVYVREIIDLASRHVETISGIHDVTQGRKPGSVSAASAIIALQEAAQARIRLKVKELESMLSDLGQCWHGRLSQFWKTDRWVRLFDKNNPEDVKFERVSPEDFEEGFDFYVLSGSTMMGNKNAMLDLMIRLAQTPAEDGLPMVDRQTVLQFTPLTNTGKIIRRFKELKGMLDEQANARAEQQRADDLHKINLQYGGIDDETLNMMIDLIEKDPQILEMIVSEMEARGGVA